MAPIGFSAEKAQLSEHECQCLTDARIWLSSQTSEAIKNIVFRYLFYFPTDRIFGGGEVHPKILSLEKIAFDEASKKLRAGSSEDPSSSYPCQGNVEYSLEHFCDEKLPASQLIMAYLSSLPAGKTYRLLDVGGGDGSFAENCVHLAREIHRDLIAHNISASDLRPSWEQLPDPHYHICDATKILDNPDITSTRWNCIVSRLTFYLLPDQLRNLCECYELLEPGGLMIITYIPFSGLSGYLGEIVEFLNERGYSCILSAKSSDHVILGSALIIQKTHPHLNLPLIYDSLTFRKKNQIVYYALDPRFLTPAASRSENHLPSSIVKPPTLVVMPLGSPLSQLFNRTYHFS